MNSLSREAASPHDSGVATLLTFNSGHCIHLHDAVPVLLIVLALRSLHLSTLQSTYTFGDKEMGLQGDWVKELEDEMSCAVCQDTIVAAHSLVPCGHCFCGTCLFQWLSRKQICPTCRSVPAILAGLSSIPLLVLDQFNQPKHHRSYEAWDASGHQDVSRVVQDIFRSGDPAGVGVSCKACSSAEKAHLPLLSVSHPKMGD